MKNIYCLGIDIGGTKTQVGIFNDERPIVTDTFPTEAFQGCKSLVERIRLKFSELSNEASLNINEIIVAGIASPGPLDLETGVTGYIPTMGFINEPIRDRLAEALLMPVFLQNDANCGALSESFCGVGKGYDSLVYITVSTGIGSGIVINGEIYDGASYLAGELGHLIVEKNGVQCGCGKNGCLEAYASGTAISGIASGRKNKDLSAKEVFDLCRTGDVECLLTVREAADKLAYAMTAVCQILDPGVIVLGGGVLKDADIFMPLLNRALHHHMQDIKSRRTEIKVSQFGGDQVMIGAVIYALESYRKHSQQSVIKQGV